MTERPRLSILHFALWATMAAAYVMLVRGATSAEPGIVGSFKLIAIAMFASTAIGGAMIVLFRGVTGRRWCTAPGEWLMLVVGVSVAFDAVKRYIPGDSLIPPTTMMRTIECAAMILPMVSRRLAWPWKLYFIAMVVLQCTVIALSIVKATTANVSPNLEAMIGMQWSLATTIPVVLAIWYRKQDSGWLHWLGVAVSTIWSSAILIVRVL